VDPHPVVAVTVLPEKRLDGVVVDEHDNSLGAVSGGLEWERTFSIPRIELMTFELEVVGEVASQSAATDEEDWAGHFGSGTCPLDQVRG
jgi:hypothetical protein